MFETTNQLYIIGVTGCNYKWAISVGSLRPQLAWNDDILPKLGDLYLMRPGMMTHEALATRHRHRRYRRYPRYRSWYGRPATVVPPSLREMLCKIHVSLDWFKGKSTGNHGFYHQI